MQKNIPQRAKNIEIIGSRPTESTNIVGVSIPIEEEERKYFGNLMINLHTLGRYGTSAITSICAIEFNIETGEMGQTFYTEIDIQSCINNGLIVDGEAIEWWVKQNKKVRTTISSGNGIYIDEVLYQFCDFLSRIGLKDLQLWGNPSKFHIGNLESAFLSCHLEIPWGSNCERDLHTLLKLTSEDGKVYFPIFGVDENPVMDCEKNVVKCVEAYKKLKSVKL